MGKYRVFLISYKTVFGLAGIGAVINEVVLLAARGTLVPANFFSYFTIQSNVIAGFSLLVSAYVLVVRRPFRGLDALRGGATLYIALTGVVFSLLLAGPDLSSLTAVPIDNTILHYLMPVVLVADWLLDRPATVIRKRTVALWLVYPLAYLAYSLIRGPIVGWYPYPFVDPTRTGYGPVAVTCSIITAGVVAAGFAVRAWSLRRSQKGPETAIIEG